VFYSAATPPGRHRIHGIPGRLTKDKLTVHTGLDVPASASAYVCGPASFMTDMQEALTALGAGPARIHTELFGALPPVNPGLTGQTRRPPHAPAGPPGTAPLVTFARSGIPAPFAASRQRHHRTTVAGPAAESDGGTPAWMLRGWVLCDFRR
jgi:ferredoxin-NADP reductase